MNTKYLLTAVALLIGAQAYAEDAKKDKADADELVGTYSIVSGERDGKAIEGDKFKDVVVKISKNAFTTYDKDKKEVYAATYTVDRSAKPWKIAMTATITPAGDKGVGTKAEGLIAPDGDGVKLIYALPQGKAPTEFKAGEKQQMFVLKKSAKSEK